VNLVRDSYAFGQSLRNCELHPLIHTLLEFTLAQIIVVGSSGEKCGLKYVNSQKTSAGFDFNDTSNPPIRFTFR